LNWQEKAEITVFSSSSFPFQAEKSAAHGQNFAGIESGSFIQAINFDY
jgi:hypothetical protein